MSVFTQALACLLHKTFAAPPHVARDARCTDNATMQNLTSKAVPPRALLWLSTQSVRLWRRHWLPVPRHRQLELLVPTQERTARGLGR